MLTIYFCCDECNNAKYNEHTRVTNLDDLDNMLNPSYVSLVYWNFYCAKCCVIDEFISKSNKYYYNSHRDGGTIVMNIQYVIENGLFYYCQTSGNLCKAVRFREQYLDYSQMYITMNKFLKRVKINSIIILPGAQSLSRTSCAIKNLEKYLGSKCLCMQNIMITTYHNNHYLVIEKPLVKPAVIFL